jgi:hypothetical protein
MIGWPEQGGPPTAAPLEWHYGGSLIRDLLPHELGGTVDLTFPPDGACCTIEIPLKRRVISERDPNALACTKTALEIGMSAGAEQDHGLLLRWRVSGRRPSAS